MVRSVLVRRAFLQGVWARSLVLERDSGGSRLELRLIDVTSVERRSPSLAAARLWVVTVAAAFAVGGLFPASALGASTWAVIVAGPDTDATPDTKVDARRFSDALRHLVPRSALDITELGVGESSVVTLSDVEAAVKQMVASASPGDTLWFVFSGHGRRHTGPDPGLVLSNSTILSVDRLSELLRPESEPPVESEAGDGDDVRVVVVLDACYLGGSFEGDPLDPQLDEFGPVAGAVVFAGANALPGVQYLRTGPVIHPLLSGMLGGADEDLDGIVSYGELGAFVRARTRGRAALFTPVVIVPQRLLMETAVQIPSPTRSIQVDVPRGAPGRLLVSEVVSEVVSEAGVRHCSSYPTTREFIEAVCPIDEPGADQIPVAEIWRDEAKRVSLSLATGVAYTFTWTSAREDGAVWVADLSASETPGRVTLKLPGDAPHRRLVRVELRPLDLCGIVLGCDAAPGSTVARCTGRLGLARYLRCSHRREDGDPLVPRVWPSDRRLGRHLSVAVMAGVELSEVYGRFRAVDLEVRPELADHATQLQAKAPEIRALPRVEVGLRGHITSGFFLETSGALSLGPVPEPETPLGAQLRARWVAGAGAMMLPVDWDHWVLLSGAAGVLGHITAPSVQTEDRLSWSTGFTARAVLSTGLTDRLVEATGLRFSLPVAVAAIFGVDLVPIRVLEDIEMRPFVYGGLMIGVEPRVRP